MRQTSKTNFAKGTGDLLLSPHRDPGWLLVEEGVDPAREREIEAILAIGNGYLGTRGSIAEGGRSSHPSTFAGGIYVPDAGFGLGPRLAVLPNWSHVEITVEGQQLSLEAGSVLEHRRLLDLRQGVLWREWRHQDPSGRITRLTYLQLASLADRHVLLQSVAVTAENYAGWISLTTSSGPSDIGGIDTARIASEPTAMLMRVSGTEVAIASASELRCPAVPTAPSHEGGSRSGEERWSCELGLGETMRLDRVVTVFTSRDVANPAEVAKDRVGRAREPGFPALVQAHVEAWLQKWEACRSSDRG